MKHATQDLFMKPLRSDSDPDNSTCALSEPLEAVHDLLLLFCEDVVRSASKLFMSPQQRCRPQEHTRSQHACAIVALS